MCQSALFSASRMGKSLVISPIELVLMLVGREKHNLAENLRL